MTNMQQSLKRLEAGIFILVIMSVLNVLFTGMSSNSSQKKDTMELPWKENFKEQLSEINEKLNILEIDLIEVEENTLSNETIIFNMVETLETSIALIIETVENKKTKFQPLREKIQDIDNDVSLLKEEFSKIEKTLQKE